MNLKLKDLVMKYLSEEDSERFAEWAFGEEYLFLTTGREFLQRWNDRHCKKYRANLAGNVPDDIKIMIETWKSFSV